MEAAFAKFDLAGNGKLNYRSVRKTALEEKKSVSQIKIEEAVSREKGEKEIDAV